MRFFILATALLTTACAQEEPGAVPGNGITTYTGGGRDRLCIRNAGDNFPAGLIVYAKGSDANCSMTGQYRSVDQKTPELVPSGDACPIELFGDPKGTITLGKLHPACAYYCGPGASLDGKSFTRLPNAGPVTDLAGDPLC